MKVRSFILGATAIVLAFGATAAPSYARNGHRTAAVVGALAGVATGAVIANQRHHYYHHRYRGYGYRGYYR